MTDPTERQTREDAAGAPSAAPLRVLSIAHTAVTRDMGRRRYHAFAAIANVELHVLAPRRWREFGRVYDAEPVDDPGVIMHVLPIAFGRMPIAQWYCHVYPRLRGLMRRIRPQVIHLWEEPWSFVALQALLLGKGAGFALEVDQNIIKRLPFPFEAIRRFTLKRTDVVLSRSPEATEVVRASGYQGPVVMLSYGIDGDRFHPLPTGAAPRKGLKLGYHGRLVASKGIDDALDALAAIDDPSVTLAIMGEGPHGEALRQRAQALGLGERVRFHGWGEHDAVAEFLRDCDVSVLLTRTTDVVREQFGRAIIESQACGAPVIGSTCGAIPYVIGAGGWVIPERDPQALAALLRRLRANPDALAQARQLGLANVAERFTFAGVAERLMEAFRLADRARMARQGEPLS